MPSSSHCLKRTLIVSLLFNVFLISGVGGGVYHWVTQKSDARIAPPQHGLKSAIARLPDAPREQLKKLLQQAHSRRQDSIKAGHEARMEVFRQLEEPILNRDTLLASLGKAREADDQGRIVVDTTVSDFLLNLSLEDRKDFAKALYSNAQPYAAEGSQ